MSKISEVSVPKTAIERLQQLARASASGDQLLKFTTGVWTIGGTTVPEGYRFTLLPAQVVHYWVRFADGKFAEDLVQLVAEGGDTELRIVRGKSREDLGHHDKALWEKGTTGEPKDPWVYGYGLPMINNETGAIVVYKTNSGGGMSAIGTQVAHHTQNLVAGRNIGNPIVTLCSGRYPNKRFGGFTQIPVFTVVGHEPPAGSVPTRDDKPNGGNKPNGDMRVIGERRAVEAEQAYDRELDDMDDDISF
jgi:hypothetical protein